MATTKGDIVLRPQTTLAQAVLTRPQFPISNGCSAEEQFEWEPQMFGYWSSKPKMVDVHVLKPHIDSDPEEDEEELQSAAKATKKTPEKTEDEKSSSFKDRIMSNFKIPALKCELTLSKEAQKVARDLKSLTEYRPNFTVQQATTKVVDVMAIIGITVKNMSLVDSLGEKCLILAQTLLASGIIKVSSLVTAFVDSVTKIFKRVVKKTEFHEVPQEVGSLDSEFTSQSGEGIEFMSMFFDIASDWFGQSAEKVPKKKFLDHFRGFSKDINAVKTIGKAVEYIMEMAWATISYIYQWITGYPLYTSKTEKIINECVAWMEYQEKLKDTLSRVPLADDASLCKEFIQQYVDGQELKVKLFENKFTQHNFTAMFVALRQSEEIADKAKSCLKTGKPRVPPVIVELVGRPGVGKTTLSNILASDLAIWYNKQMARHIEPANFSWSRKIDNEYWDGYDHQFCVKYDDYMQYDDEAIRTATVTEIIYMGNTEPFQVHMSSIPDKAGTYFDSKLVILTSNDIKMPNNINIQDKTAFKRRKKFLVEVLIKDECKVGATNVGKNGQLERDSYKFKYRDPMNEEAEIGEGDYADLFFKIRDSLYANIKSADQLGMFVKTDYSVEYAQYCKMKNIQPKDYLIPQSGRGEPGKRKHDNSVDGVEMPSCFKKDDAKALITPPCLTYVRTRYNLGGVEKFSPDVVIPTYKYEWTYESFKCKSDVCMIAEIRKPMELMVGGCIYIDLPYGTMVQFNTNVKELIEKGESDLFMACDNIHNQMSMMKLWKIKYSHHTGLITVHPWVSWIVDFDKCIGNLLQMIALQQGEIQCPPIYDANGQIIGFHGLDDQEVDVIDGQVEEDENMRQLEELMASEGFSFDPEEYNEEVEAAMAEFERRDRELAEEAVDVTELIEKEEEETEEFKPQVGSTFITETLADTTFTSLEVGDKEAFMMRRYPKGTKVLVDFQRFRSEMSSVKVVEENAEKYYIVPPLFLKGFTEEYIKYLAETKEERNIYVSEEQMRNMSTGMNELKDQIWRIQKETELMFEKNHTLKKVIAMLSTLSTLLASYTVYNLYQHFSSKPEQAGEPQSMEKKIEPKLTKQRPPQANRSMQKLNFKSQAGNTWDISRIIRQNTALLKYTSSKGTVRHVYAVFLTERVFMTVKHFFLYYDGEGEFELEFNDKTRTPVRFKPDEVEATEDPDNDFVIVMIKEPLKRKIPEFRDITKHFVPEEYIGTGNMSQTYVFVANAVESNEQFHSSANTTVSGKMFVDIKGKKVESANTLEYPALTGEGDCGSCIILDAPGYQGTIVGIHTAYSQGRKLGRGVIVTKEVIMSTIEMLLGSEYMKRYTQAVPQSGMEKKMSLGSEYAEHLEEVTGLTIDTSRPSDFKYNESVDYLGQIPQYAVRFSTKTHIVPSLLHEHFGEATTAPAMLAPDRDRGIYPLQQAMEKIGQPVQQDVTDKKLIEDINLYLLHKIKPVTKPRVFSVDEGVNGVPTTEYIRTIDMNTSYGFNRENIPRVGGKKNHFDWLATSEKWVPKPHVVNRINQLEEAYARGEKGCSISELHQKDERRTLDRVESGNTRVIVSEECPHLILGRRYFGAFMEAVARNHIDLRVFIGLNPHSREWREMIEREEEFWKKEPIDMDGDAKNYDWSTELHSQKEYIDFVNMWYRYYTKFYSDHELTDLQMKQLERECTIREGIDADTGSDITILVGKDLIHPWKGYLSGSFQTALKHCITGLREHMYCFLYNAKKAKEMYDSKDPKLKDFLFDEGLIDDPLMEFWIKDTEGFNITIKNIDSYFMTNVGGDDFRSVLHKGSSWYTFAKMRHTMKEQYSRVYTSADKQEVVGTGHKPYLTATYLGRTFRKEAGEIFAPMSIADIVETLNWVRDKIDPRLAVQQNCESALREFFHHGKDVFYLWQTKINNALLQHGLKPIYLNYTDLLGEYRNATGIKPDLPRLDIEQEYVEWKAQSSEEKGTNQDINTQETANISLTELTVTENILQPTQEQRQVVRRQPFMNGSDPYPSQNLEKVLERKYLVNTTVWSGNDTFNTQKIALNFPYALINATTNIQEKLSYFDLFRADVELEILINSTQFHFGLLQGCWYPSYNNSLSAVMKTDNIYTESTSNSFIVSASSPAPVIFTIPYLSPAMYANTVASGTNNIAYFGAISLRVLVPLKLIGSASTPTVNVNVFARFKNIEVAAPSLVQVTYRLTDIEKRQFEKYIHKSNSKKEEVNGGGFRPQSAEFHPQSGKSKAKDARQPEVPPSTEQDLKTEKGTISSALESVSGVTSLITNTGLLGPLEPVGEGIAIATKIGSKIASLFGYNKPISKEPTAPVYLTTVNNMAYGSGMITQDDLAMFPENHTSDTPDNFGIKEDEMQLRNLYMKPGLVEVWSFTSSAVAGQVIKTYYVTPTTAATYNYVYTTGKNAYKTYHTPLSVIAYQFGMWRGTIKYYVVICCSRYTVGRIRISWHPTYAEIPSSFSDGGGDFISNIIDFSGDTTFAFSVPYLQQRVYSTVEDSWNKNTAGTNGAIAFSIVNAVNSSTSVGDSTVNVAVYIAGAEDMDFVQLREREIPSTYTGRAVVTTPSALPSSATWVAQSGESKTRFLRDLFMDEFPTLIPAKAHSVAFVGEGEKVKDVRSIIHRFNQAGSSTITLTNQTWTQLYIGNILNLTDNSFNIFANWFMYRKGGLNWKLVRSYQATAEPNGVITVTFGLWNYVTGAYINPSTLSNPFGRQGIVLQEMSYKPSLEWRQHYISQWGCQEHNLQENYAVDEGSSWLYFETLAGSSATTATYRPYFSAADDFTFGWGLGVPVLWCYQ